MKSVSLSGYACLNARAELATGKDDNFGFYMTFGYEF